jgi:hypothetical protein
MISRITALSARYQRGSQVEADLPLQGAGMQASAGLGCRCVPTHGTARQRETIPTTPHRVPIHLDRQLNLAPANARECTASVPDGAVSLCSVALRGPRTSSVIKMKQERTNARIAPSPRPGNHHPFPRTQAEAALMLRVAETMKLPVASHEFGRAQSPATPHFQQYGLPGRLVLPLARRPC